MTWLTCVQGYLLAGASIGMQFTDITVWLAIAMTLSVFQISKVDEESEKASVFVGCVSIVSNLRDPSSVLTSYLLSAIHRGSSARSVRGPRVRKSSSYNLHKCDVSDTVTNEGRSITLVIGPMGLGRSLLGRRQRILYLFLLKVWRTLYSSCRAIFKRQLLFAFHA